MFGAFRETCKNRRDKRHVEKHANPDPYSIYITKSSYLLWQWEVRGWGSSRWGYSFTRFGAVVASRKAQFLMEMDRIRYGRYGNTQQG